jgi:hypothetical protein
MPIHLTQQETDAIYLEDLIEWLSTQRFDLSQSEEFLEAACMLKRLSNNREFLADRALAELKEGYTDDASIFIYSAQVMMLYSSIGKETDFAIRANFWPSLKDQQIRAAGTGPFFYHRPHDHNFNFLTVGYHGPGYWSNYYEYNHKEVAGYPEEPVPSLKFIEKKALPQGHMMLYRASVDVHDQLPADEMSISLNILEHTPRTSLVNQYAFNLEERTIKQIINTTLAPCIFNIAAMVGGENGIDTLQELSKSAKNPLMRFSAHKALASIHTGKEEYCTQMEKATHDEDRLVHEWARLHINTIHETLAE